MFSRNSTKANLNTSEAVLSRVSQHVLRDRSLERWQRFMTDNESAFGVGSQAKYDEYSLDATDVHHQYQALVEQSLKEALADVGLSSSAFSQLCSELDLTESRSGNVQAFLELVLGATNFATFGDIMRDKAKRSYYFQIMSMWRQSIAAQNQNTHREAK